MEYKEIIDELVTSSALGIDKDVRFSGKIPTTVSSEFITNKEQGDWAENLVFEAINRNSSNFIAVRYGRNENLSAGDPGFKEFYQNYQKELNTIGKKPDILIFKKDDYIEGQVLQDEDVMRAVCAIEVRSSSFLVNKYEEYMRLRLTDAIENINKLKKEIFDDEKLVELLQKKDMTIYEYLKNYSEKEYHSISFRTPSWRSSMELQRLSGYLKKIKEYISVIQRRDCLSITPKLEDIALVNRWIQVYNVPHYYLQVFFDKAYILSFKGKFR